MKDLHSHLLFGIDDGSKSLDESICLLKKMQEQNITDLICTPHYIENSKYVCNNKDKLKKIKKLKEKIRKENININLYLGNELFITPNVVDLINKKEVRTLNNSRYILFEFPMNNIYLNTKEIIKKMISNRYIPILAHPERYPIFQKNPEKIEEYLQITSPFLDRFNDYLQVYAKIDKNNEILLTDDSYIINNLQDSGIDITSPKRKQLLDSFLRKYRINLEDKSLSIKSSIEEFPQKILFLMQAMINIDDMFMLSQNRVASLFLDDIKGFFDKNEIFYTENVNFLGKSGFFYSYEYLLQRTKEKPERLCKVINNPNKQNLQNTLFMWNDTKETRNKDAQLIVFLNDENKIDSGVIEGFKNYEVNTILWSEKEKSLDILTA